MRTLTRRFALMFGLLLGVIASQLPEYAQQYRQRLGGALDEINRVVADFDAQASASGLKPEAALKRLDDNPDEIARGRAGAMRETMARRDRLAEAQARFTEAGPFARVALLARDFDMGVARGAWAAFEPAVPLTREGLLCGAAGLLVGYGAWRVAAAPFGRRRRVEAARACLRSGLNEICAPNRNG